MKKFLSSILLVIMILAMATIHALAQEAQGISEVMENATGDLVGSGKVKGAVLSVVKDGKIQTLKGFGFADEYFGIAADGEKTAFRIGSVSKTFVAVAAQILVQEGLLDMHSDISVYLESDFPSLSYPVSMHQLLTHTAGFEDKVTGMAVTNVSDTEPLAKSVRKYMPEQIFKPGEVVSYSNYGIALAAYVIECISDQDFAQYCKETIFLPLDMNRTTYEYMHDVAYVSKPYLPDGRETLEPYMNLYPEGSAVSTAEDMAKYMLWLLNNEDTRVLTAKSKEEIFVRQFTMSDDLEGVGYTWNRKARNNTVYYDKKGETLHFYTRIALYPEKKTGIFLCFNTYLPEHEINTVMQQATDLLYGPAENPDPGSTQATLDISGCYVNNWSSFETPEKILRYLVPSKMLNISGSLDTGFFLNDEKMALIGEDTYSSPFGIFRFVEKDGKIMIATESAITYSRVPFWQQSLLQAMIPLLFLILALICLVWEFILVLRKSKKSTVFFLICSLIQVLSLVVLCILMLKGIIIFSLLSFSLYMSVCGWLILAACAAGLVYLLCNKPKCKASEILHLSWNLSGILFCLWMLWMNIIL